MKILNAIDGFVWGPVLIWSLILVGIFATIASGAFQFRHFAHIMKNTFGKLMHGQKETDADAERAGGQLTPFQAISMAIGGAVGTGNIGGVATAIAVGGPGAILWMFLEALIGMVMKMMEVTLAVYYRHRKANGEFYGGPTYYMQDGIGRDIGRNRPFFNVLWRVLAAIFTAGLLSTVVFTMTTYNVAEAMSSTVGHGSLLFWGILYSCTTFAVIVGGMIGVAKIMSKLVPFMCLFYVISAIAILIINVKALPGAIALICRSAFNPRAALGGTAGITFALTINQGFKRALYSNEAAWGTSPMIHASTKVNHPVKQGMWGAFEVFVDTCVVCTITGLVIVTTGVYGSGLSGAALTLSAFEHGLGTFARWIIAISVYLFAFSTTGGWWAYNEVLFNHFLGDHQKAIKVSLQILKVIYPLAGLITVLLAIHNPESTSGGIWVMADIGSGVPTFANLIALMFFFPKFHSLIKDYKARYMGRGTVDPKFRVFYNEEGSPQLKTTVE